jgi:hypothetical protein
MRYAVLISARRDLSLLSDLTGEFSRRGIFPDFLSSEAMGHASVRVRLELDCDEPAIHSLAVFWKNTLGIDLVMVTPLDAKGSPMPEPTPASHGR